MSSGPSALTARAGNAPETTDHAVPLQCSTEKSANAQAFVGLKSSTALRMPSLGPATTDHASLAPLAATDSSAHSGVLPDGVGVGTDDQAVPFQFSATGAALAVAGPPTTQASVSERAYDPVSSAPAVEAGGVTAVPPGAAGARAGRPSSPAVIPASVHHRETRVMKISS